MTRKRKQYILKTSLNSIIATIIWFFIGRPFLDLSSSAMNTSFTESRVEMYMRSHWWTVTFIFLLLSFFFLFIIQPRLKGHQGKRA